MAANKSAQRGAASVDDTPSQSRFDRLSLEDLKIFLACTDYGSFREAARAYNLNNTTILRRIERLEYLIGKRLFHRVNEGITPTEEGEQLAVKARAIHRSFSDLERLRFDADEEPASEAVIAVTEGLGSYWVMPRLVEFQRNNPKGTLSLYCAMESVDVLNLEADISVQFIRPSEANLIVSKLGRLHIYPFAAQSYLDTYGVPKSLEEMKTHRLVEQVAPQIDNSALARFLGLPSIRHMVGVRTNNSTAHLYAIEKGGGIGGLPTFAYALGAPVVPVDLGKGYSIDIWMAYHPEIRHSKQKMRVVNWVRSIFDPAVYPWFRENLIHPLELVRMVPREAAENQGRGFTAVEPIEASRLLRKR